MLFDLSKLPDNIREQILTNPRYTKMFNEFPKKLLGFSKDAKTSKGLKKGVLTGILYLTPYKNSGVNLCAMAHIALCFLACLFTAGRGAMNVVQMGRLRKTLMYLQYPDKFKSMLIADIKTLQRKAKRDNLEPMVRLNGTSDIRWEIVFPEIFSIFYGIQFYDYTKISNRKLGKIQNYDLTYSYSGVKKYQPFVDKAIKDRMRMAVVFEKYLPKTFKGLKVVNGDDTDIRPYDAQGVVVGLLAKGKARQDTSGFVVRQSN
jgi:hypothetical protein